MPESILVFGTGAIGTTVGAWLTQSGADVCLLSRGATAEVLADKGIRLYRGEQPDRRDQVRVRVETDLARVGAPDIVLVTVKNYALEAASKQIREALGDGPIVVGLQNGIDNQRILPDRFSKVVYGIVNYNAWLDEPGIAGYQRKGPIVIAVPASENPAARDRVAEALAPALNTIVTDRFDDAVYSKLVINLSNSLATLIGHGVREISDPDAFQRLLTNLTYEGTRIVRAAGYREFHVKGQPSWMLITIGAKVPRMLTRATFRRTVKTMVMTSMGQDVLQRGRNVTELESLNGVLIRLADQHGIAAPYNRTVHELCRQRFAASPFEPMDVRDVLAAVERRLAR